MLKLTAAIILLISHGTQSVPVFLNASVTARCVTGTMTFCSEPERYSRLSYSRCVAPHPHPSIPHPRPSPERRGVARDPLLLLGEGHGMREGRGRVHSTRLISHAVPCHAVSRHALSRHASPTRRRRCRLVRRLAVSEGLEKRDDVVDLQRRQLERLQQRIGGHRVRHERVEI